MFNFMKGNGRKKKQKAYEQVLEKALHAQRNGDLRKHASLMEEAEKLYAELETMK